MPGRLGPRFALEAVFLVALAVALGLADLTTTAIVVVMAVAWALVALVEWLASRESEAWRRHELREPWREREPEPETQLVAPAPVEEDTADGEPAVPPPAEPKRRWFRRGGRSEESRAER